MDVKQLEYFRAIVDAGTISGAARVLHMTQPPLSYQVKMLEEELQVQLFLRGTKKITLTEAGKTLYDRAGSLLTMADITKREVIKASQAATIHIGFTPSTVGLGYDNISFQSTLPRRERRQSQRPSVSRNSNFNPRSREGSDSRVHRKECSDVDFNPRSREGSDVGTVPYNKS